MKKIQKSIRVVVYTIIVSFSFNSFVLFAENFVDVKNSYDGYQEFCIQANNLAKNSIHMKSALLEECINVIMHDAERNGTERLFSDDCMLFCEKILNQQTEFAPEEVIRALPELLSFLSTKIEKTRAPRLDAPGSSDGSIVGPLLTCSNEQILELIDQLIMLIEQCCNTIQIDFADIFIILTTLVEDLGGTFTFLQDLKNTVTIDFNGTFTALAACCNQTFVDFNGVFTTLSDIKNTLTIDFNGTFTVVASIGVDFGSTFTALNDLESSIINGFNGTFTALASCCNKTSVDFNGVFTTLADLNETLTTDFNGTFTALNACCNKTFVDFNGVFTTLTDLKNTLSIDFSGTFTAIAAFTIPCNATPITQATIITSPGYYCLSNDLVSTLTIAARDVTVDLNNKIIHATGQVGVYINDASNVLITNGTINATSIGIEVINTSTINFNNLLITNCSDTGILLNTSCRVIKMSDIVINTVGNHGINCMNNNDDLQCKRVMLVNFGGTFGIGTNGSISNSLFEECEILDSVLTLNSVACFSFVSGNNNQLINCAVVNIQNSIGTAQAFTIGSNNSSLDTCITLSLVGANLAEGYLISGHNSLLNDCLVLGAQSVNGSYGFIISGSTVTLNNCFVQTATLAMGSPVGAGFDVSGSDVNLINCTAFQMVGIGFHVKASSSNSLLLNCGAARNGGDGFTLDSANTVVGNCNSFNNIGFGFNVASASIPMYHCFASGNVINNYSPAAPFVQPASQNTLVFARGNNFI